MKQTYNSNTGMLSGKNSNGLISRLRNGIVFCLSSLDATDFSYKCVRNKSRECSGEMNYVNNVKVRRARATKRTGGRR